jgi:putative zinc finger protein
MTCEEIRHLAPEIALGIADGEERAEALRHLSTCPDCQRVVEQLSEVADELLVLAPAQEPPAGFESRVLQAIGKQRQPRRRNARRLSLRWLAPRLGPSLAAAAVTAAVLVGVYHDDHQTAERYRGVLAEAGGSYFQAQQLADRTGARTGVAFGYEGSPSWLFVTVDREYRDAITTCELVTRDGRTIPLPSMELDRKGTWGGAIPVSLYKVASVRLLGQTPSQTLQASFARGVSEGN